MKNISIAFSKVIAVLVSVTLISGCSLFGGGAKDIEAEAVLNPDTAMVFAVDHSNMAQLKNLKGLLDAFPETGLKKMMIDQYNAGVVAEELTYETGLKPILDADWRIVFGVVFPEGAESIMDIDGPDMEIGIVFEFEKADEVEVLLDKLIAEGTQEVEKTTDGDFTFWHGAQGGLYVSRYGDLFFVSMEEGQWMAAVERVKNGGGFVMDGVVAESDLADEGKLGYMYINGDVMFPLLESAYTEAGFDLAAQYFAGGGDVYLAVRAEDDGFAFDGLSEMLETEGSVLFEMYENLDLNLVEKVPGDGMILYMENYDLDIFLENTLYSLTFEERSYGYSEEELPDYYAEFLKEATAIGGISEDELKAILKSPYAVAISDAGTMFPAMALYIQLDEGEVESAKTLAKGIDKFMDEVIVEMEKDFAEAGASPGLVKKDKALVRGEALTKIYIDLTQIPEESIAELEAILGDQMADQKVEFYYGVTGDDVFVIAAYPDFPDAYGSTVLADDPVYMEAVAKLDGVYGAGVTYVNFVPAMEMVDNFVKLAKDSGEMTDAEYMGYLPVKNYVKSLKYMISSGKIEGDLLMSSAYLKIEKEEE